MKISHIAFLGASVFLAACNTAPRQNDQQAFDGEFSEARLFLMALQSLDSGDVAKTRQIALFPVCEDIASMSSDGAKDGLTPGQKQKLVSLARGALDYLLAHRQQVDGRLASVQRCVRGLEKILTDPDDVRRLAELSDYFEKQHHDS
jgi:hypothetical protein